MSMNRYCLSVVAFCLLLAADAFAQRVENVSGKYSYFVDEKANMTFLDARQKAVENARTEALKEAFGSMISSDIVTEVSTDAEGNSKSELREITHETARGEWIADSEEPSVDIRYDSTTRSFVYDVTVSGKARKIVSAKADFEWKVLCEGTEDVNERESFNSGEHIYVSFKSPVAGYLAIYLLGDDGTVNCLLPYPDNPDGICRVRAGNRYVFFDKERDSSAPRYRLKTGKGVENDVLYLIFSTNPFTKCLDEKSDPTHPNKLSVSDFEKWRFSNMRSDSRMVSEKKWIRIVNNSK